MSFFDAGTISARDSVAQQAEVLILMELCTGGRLIDVIQLRNGHPFSKWQVLRIFIQVCKAVALMHLRNPPWIHRDLKVCFV